MQSGFATAVAVAVLLDITELFPFPSNVCEVAAAVAVPPEGVAHAELFALLQALWQLGTLGLWHERRGQGGDHPAGAEHQDGQERVHKPKKKNTVRERPELDFLNILCSLSAHC